MSDGYRPPTLDDLAMSHEERRAAMAQMDTAELRALVRRQRAKREWSDDRSPERAWRVLSRFFAEEELRARGETP